MARNAQRKLVRFRLPQGTRAGSSKVPKTFRLTPAKIVAAQKILGTATATETIEVALDLVVFREELVTGTRAMLGADIDLVVD